MTDQWTILRCRSSHTLRLALSLSMDGIPAWTPTEIQLRGRRGKDRHEVQCPIMPSYVFADARFVDDLLRFKDQPACPHPRYSLFRPVDDRITLVSDTSLTGLRHVERKKSKPRQFKAGQSVSIPDGAFQGLTGQVVKDSNGGDVLIAFPGFAIPITFAAYTLPAAA